jgi:predicted amidophosphoribosyltransferase
MICINCGEWFEVYLNSRGTGLHYCPCCGYEFTQDDFIHMLEEDGAK